MSLPTISTHRFELDRGRYDTAQLIQVVDTALKAKSDTTADFSAGPSDAPSDRPPLVHIHTLTIEATIEPPPARLQYWRQPDRENPECEAYMEMLGNVSSSIDAMAPLSLAQSKEGILHQPKKADRYQTSPLSDHDYSSLDVFAQSTSTRALLRLPLLPQQVAREWLAKSTAWDLSHWLPAAIALDPEEPSTRKGNFRDDKKRFYLDTTVDLIWMPGDDGLEQVTASIIIKIGLHLDVTTISIPLPDVGDDLVGLVLHSVMPASSNSSSSDSENRSKALRAFFDCLHPAPDLPATLDTDLLQPTEMVSTLYPFQKRTLSLLLKREAAPIFPGSDGKVMANDPPGFWQKVDHEEDPAAFAYRRITGDLQSIPIAGPSSSRPVPHVDPESQGLVEELLAEEDEMASLPMLLDLSGVRGTMLCEEMGLGKTVEAIALILLNRHPLSSSRPLSSEDDVAMYRLKPKAEVPVIDLLAGPPGLKDPAMRHWVRKEREAFAKRKVWDETSQLDVVEVATTLIVTPPSLLRQWVSEIEKHCPSLRVCVYDGWKSLQKGIETQRQAGKHAEMKNNELKKRKANEQLRRKTVKKYARGENGEPIKGEEEEEEVVPDVVAESSLDICQRQFVDYVRAHDVVITTYGELATDLAVAFPAPARSRRSTADYQLNERPRTPLIMVEWWRVIMDEVQLHGDQSAAASMVSLIPRRNSLAMSGTPARTDIRDLMGSLKFLRVPVLPNDPKLWHRLQQAPMRPAFESLFQELAVRTTKKEVAGEFNLPSQKRYVIPIELSEIELHYYNDTLDRQKEILRLPNDSRDAREADWTLDRSLFRSCLMNLRQICTHIQVGQMQGQGRGERRLVLGRQLMTMKEALDKMKNDHAQEYLIESRKQHRVMIKKAQLLILDEEVPTRHQSALHLYQLVRERVLKQIEPVKKTLDELLIDHDDSEDGGTPVRELSEHERLKRGQITLARANLREMRIILHQTWFFEGDVHHVNGEAEQEAECYEAAEQIRKDILARPLHIANTNVGILAKMLAQNPSLKSSSELQTKHVNLQGAILSDDIIRQSNELLQILNGNAELVFHWRRKIVELLSSPMESEAVPVPNQGQKDNKEKASEKGKEKDNEEDSGKVTENAIEIDKEGKNEGDNENGGKDHEEEAEVEEDQYTKALKAQGEVEAYLVAYAAAIADRREFILEDRTQIGEHAIKVTKQRTTKASKDAEIIASLVNAPDDVAEQASMLMSERTAFRDARTLKDCTRPVKMLLIDLNAIASGQDRMAEAAVARMAAETLKQYVKDQTEHIKSLEKELESFRATFNRRVVYFAALQEISDSVSAPEFKDLAVDIAQSQTAINDLEGKLARMVVKGRYLQNLGTKEMDDDELREDCIICMGSSDAKHAVLLECGHFFCKPCFREYQKSAAGRTCPHCRAKIDPQGVRQIKLAGADVKDKGKAKAVLEDIGEAEPSAGPAQSERDGADEIAAEAAEEQRREDDLARLNNLGVERRREIARQDIMGEFGSKIDFLIKHLIWYRSYEPTVRHVIFSNWSDSLNIVIQALNVNHIKYVAFDQGSKRKDVVEKFKNDTSITVFLLHAERESSGLTLTSCRVVHLLEPVLKHSFELQAIGRVDRLGQDQETEVYCYATSDTVESKILLQGIRNGTSIYLKEGDAGNAVADMPNVVSAAHKGGDIANDGKEEELLSLIT